MIVPPVSVKVRLEVQIGSRLRRRYAGEPCRATASSAAGSSVNSLPVRARSDRLQFVNMSDLATRHHRCQWVCRFSRFKITGLEIVLLASVRRDNAIYAFRQD